MMMLIQLLKKHDFLLNDQHHTCRVQRQKDQQKRDVSIGAVSLSSVSFNAYLYLCLYLYLFLCIFKVSDSECSLSICAVLERIKDLLQGHSLSTLLINSLPYNPIGTFTYSLTNLILPGTTCLSISSLIMN